jgi:hypothetical protein
MLRRLVISVVVLEVQKKMPLFKASSQDVDTIVAYTVSRPGDSSAVGRARNFRVSLIAAVLAVLGWTSCAVAQGTKDPSNPIVAYPTNPERRLDNPPTGPRYIYSPYGGVYGVPRLRRLHPRYRY